MACDPAGGPDGRSLGCVLVRYNSTEISVPWHILIDTLHFGNLSTKMSRTPVPGFKNSPRAGLADPGPDISMLSYCHQHLPTYHLYKLRCR